MATTNLVYGAAETRTKISEIQNTVKNGLIPKMVNKNTHETSYMMNHKIIKSLLEEIVITNSIEYDNDLKVYTAFNEQIPQIYGEGTTEAEAFIKLIKEAKVFAEDYAENIELFSNILDGIQQFIVGNILLNMDNDNMIKEILRVA